MRLRLHPRATGRLLAAGNTLPAGNALRGG